MSKADQAPCPLCHSSVVTDFYEDKHRPYLQCGQCDLVFVPPAFYLSSEQEKAEYDLHDNQVDDAGYRKFLSRVWTPLAEKLSANSHVLDFGCGPGPALAAMMKEAGMKVSLYDHFYYPNPKVLIEAGYHGITATEVIEHLHTPAKVFASWVDMLKPNGWLAVMTKLVKDQSSFANWHYKNDRTHVCFFSQQTFRWLADRHGLTLTFHGNDVMLFNKPT